MHVFANNITVEIVQVIEGRPLVVGYVFASAGGAAGSQEQRWVLYAEYSGVVGATLRLRRPSELHQHTSLTAFKSAVSSQGSGGLWRSGATYVKVNASASSTFSTFTETAGAGPPKRAPAISAITETAGAGSPQRPPVRDLSAGAGRGRLPREAPPKGPRGAGRPAAPRDFGILSGPPAGQFHDRVRILQSNVLTGLATGSPRGNQGDSVSANFEHWVLYPGYKQPLSEPGMPETVLEIVKETAGSPAGFLAEVQKDWVAGSTLINANCTYYPELPEAL